MKTYRRRKMVLKGCRHRSTNVLLPFLVLPLISITVYLLLTSSAGAVESFCSSGSNPDPNVLWCDDFDDSVSPEQKYWIYNNGGGEGSFTLVNGIGLDGSAGMQVVWQPGQVEAGNIKMLFGRSPFTSGIYTDVDFKEVYWRVFVKMKEGWTGNPYKFARATIMATPNWAQAMIAHLWEGSADTLGIDPASGIDENGNLATTVYNDFPNLHWLGHKAGVTPIFSSAASGRWYCVEAHVKLNTPGFSDGVFEFWVDGNQEASSNDLNWVGTWQEYGINAIFIENYWNGGAPGERTRFFDNFVISKTRIGCNPAGASDSTLPAVKSTNPSNNQTGVPVNTSVSASFSEAVDPPTVTTATFFVRQESTSIPGIVTLNGTTATFTPSTPFAYNMTYTATVTTSVKDAADNPLANDYNWTFTTEEDQQTLPPVTGGDGGGGGGCTVSKGRKSKDESPFGMILSLFFPLIFLLLRKTICNWDSSGGMRSFED